MSKSATTTADIAHSHARHPAAERVALHGLLAEFDSPEATLAAARKVRDGGYAKWDVHTPFPVHGMDAAMGIRPTILPWIVLICGLTGCGLGLLMQWWMNAVDYKYVISGKPFFSLPAFIPVIFEVTVLLSAFGATFGMLALNNLPRHHHPLFGSPRFRRASDDRFFIAIDAADPKFELGKTQKFLESIGAAAVERLDDRGDSRPPRILLHATATLACLALIPMAVVAYMRVSKSPNPRIHIIKDMDNQEKYAAGKQMASSVFLDGRSMRPQPVGTIARSDTAATDTDIHYHEGRAAAGEWAMTIPSYRPELQALSGTTDGTLSEKFIQRGQNRFNVYCAPCHGYDGSGNGRVWQVAQKKEYGIVQPKNMHDADIRERPVGHIFNTITNGIRTMGPYGDQIKEVDRWAIVAYVRALQKSHNARLDDVPADKRAELR